MIPISKLGEGDHYSEMAFVTESGDVDRIYRIDVPTGEDIKKSFSKIYEYEGKGYRYEQTKRLVTDYYGQASIYRYRFDDSRLSEESYGWTERGQSLSDNYHNKFLENRARDIAKNAGAKFTVKDGIISIHFDDSEDDVNYSLNVDTTLDEIFGSYEEDGTAKLLEEGFEKLKNTEVDTKTIRNIATRIKNMYGSTTNLNNLVDDFTKAFAYMQNEDFVKDPHGLKIMQVKKAPIILEHPAIILNSKSTKFKDGVVVVSDVLDYKKDPIIIALHQDTLGKYEINGIEPNALASMYGRKNFINFLQTTHDINGVMYVDKKRSQSLFALIGVQFPSGALNKISFNKILHTVDDFVNYPATYLKHSIEVSSEGTPLTEAQLEYFKDSKVRDDQGRLKVMYHGTKEIFTVFDPLKLGGLNGKAEGYGIYFADTNEVSKNYGGNILKGYLNITKTASKFERNISTNDLQKLIKSTCEKEA